MAEVYVKSGEAARLLGVSVGTLGRWYERKILVPAQIFPSGRRRYSMTQINEFIAKQESQSPISEVDFGDGEVYMSSRQVTAYAGITISLLNSLEAKGHLIPRRKIPTSGKRLYALSDVDAFLARISTQ